MNLSIHPSVGVAGPGNCAAEICLSSDSIGRNPFNAYLNGNSSCSITVLKINAGFIKSRWHPFRILYKNRAGVNRDTWNIASVEWTVYSEKVTISTQC